MSVGVPDRAPRYVLRCLLQGRHLASLHRSGHQPLTNLPTKLLVPAKALGGKTVYDIFPQ
jgi:hypothetical protein